MRKESEWKHVDDDVETLTRYTPEKCTTNKYARWVNGFYL